MVTKHIGRYAIMRSAERLSQRLARYLTAELARLEVTDLEAHVLLHLPEGGRSVAELQAALGLAASTLTGVIDRLEERGLVRRTLNLRDRRSFRILPRPAGVAAAGQVRALSDRFEGKVRARVTSAELEGFARVVQAIEEVVD